MITFITNFLFYTFLALFVGNTTIIIKPFRLKVKEPILAVSYFLVFFTSFLQKFTNNDSFLNSYLLLITLLSLINCIYIINRQIKTNFK